MSTWMAILLGGAAAGVALATSAILATYTLYILDWVTWKRRQLKKRKEWTLENPYWKEAQLKGEMWMMGTIRRAVNSAGLNIDPVLAKIIANHPKYGTAENPVIQFKWDVGEYPKAEER